MSVPQTSGRARSTGSCWRARAAPCNASLASSRTTSPVRHSSAGRDAYRAGRRERGAELLRGRHEQRALEQRLLGRRQGGAGVAATLRGYVSQKGVLSLQHRIHTETPAPATRYNLSARRTQPAAAGPERERSPCARPRAADYTSTSKPARPTAAFAAALAGVPRRPSFSSADSTPLSNAAARAAQPASVICVPLSLRRRCTCRGRRRQEGSDALVTEWIVAENENLQRGQPLQGRREGHQRRVGDGAVGQVEGLEPRQGASAQGGGERRGACVAHVHMADREVGHGWQRARAQHLRQPPHAVGRA
eukprot:scaffold84286_cov63-Phaeocystis_antarctica.AAC.6